MPIFAVIMVAKADIFNRGTGLRRGNQLLRWRVISENKHSMQFTGYISYNDIIGANVQENFTYDNLRRLKTYGSSAVNYSTNYSGMRNITFKSDAGTLDYTNSSRPFQITEQTNFPPTMDTDYRTATYTSSERPLTIFKSGKTATFSYNHANERTMMEVKTGSTVNYTRIYLGGNYERELGGSTTIERLYLGGTPYSAPAVATRTNGGAWQVHYIHRDYLGSIVAITSDDNIPVETNSYDAWGDCEIHQACNHLPTIYHNKPCCEGGTQGTNTCLISG